MLLWVMIAGGLGSGARYLVGVSLAGASFPYATVIINIVGCFLLGLVAQVALSGGISPETRTVVAAGFLGGFTTYSSFNHETLVMMTSGAMTAAAANVLMTLVGGLAAGALGVAAGRFLSA